MNLRGRRTSKQPTPSTPSTPFLPPWTPQQLQSPNWQGQVARRDGARCWICRGPLVYRHVSKDHYEPQANGGRNHVANYKLAHPVCNQVRNLLMPGDRRWAAMLLEARRQRMGAVLRAFRENGVSLAEFTTYLEAEDIDTEGTP